MARPFSLFAYRIPRPAEKEFYRALRAHPPHSISRLKASMYSPRNPGQPGFTYPDRIRNKDTSGAMTAEFPGWRSTACNYSRAGPGASVRTALGPSLLTLMVFASRSTSSPSAKKTQADVGMLASAGPGL